jgi:hypothetical protein
MYPDLTERVNRWRKIFLSSKTVNAIATDFEIDVSCGCCPDPELYVRVFIETPHGRVYGVPYQMGIGERDEGVEYPADDWESRLHAHGVHPSIIDRLKERFDDQSIAEQQVEGE